MPPIPFEHKRRETTAKLAALMLANAFIFQEQLSSLDARVRPIRELLARHDFIGDTAAHWWLIIENIDYVPIFTVARDILLSLPASSDTDKSIRKLAARALDIVSKKAALRHDLMGRIYHLLLLEAKYLGTYYTSVPAATLLLKLSLDIDRWPDADWADLSSLKNFQIADMACGTGTLLMAASQALTDNFIKFRVSRDESVDDAALKALHRLIVEEMLHGYDVLPSAVHLTASTLALLAPDTCFNKMRLYSLRLGKVETGQIYLGSLDYISENMIRTQLDLMSPAESARTAGSDDPTSMAPLPPRIDLCVMNPPFVRSVGGNLLFGSIPDKKQRKQLQDELARRIRTNKLRASSTAGLGAVFAAVADKHLNDGGRLSLVLPAAVSTGVAWEKTRAIINHGYVLETVIASHDPSRWNFSENTDLSELLLIARKIDRTRETARSIASQPTHFINLWRNPTSSAHALAIGEQVSRRPPAPIGTVAAVRHGITELAIGNLKFGEMIEVPWGEVRAGQWLGCAYAQTDLVRTVWFLRKGQFYRPGRRNTVPLPVQRLGDVAIFGPDRRDIADGFTLSASRTGYPAFWGHKAEAVRSIAVGPNRWLAPRSHNAKGRPLRDASLLWGRAGGLMIAERTWLATQRTLAVRLPKPALSNVWWPVRVLNDDTRVEKIIALWLNSTLGLLMMIGHRVPTRGAWVQFKKPTLKELPVLNISALTETQKKQLASAYDALAEKELGPIAEMAGDPARSAIDAVFAKALDIPALDDLRDELAQEPIISLLRCGGEEPAPAEAIPAQFELL
jgi:hypothetical protein